MSPSATRQPATRRREWAQTGCKELIRDVTQKATAETGAATLVRGISRLYGEAQDMETVSAMTTELDSRAVDFGEAIMANTARSGAEPE